MKPEPGVFLKYAPIEWRYDIPYEKQSDPGVPLVRSGLVSVRRAGETSRVVTLATGSDG